ncbi:MAG: pyridoxamine 5'-phosphate oxidase family protein [Azospirillaceae bacterium]|nr:pyridoxamine 5'-phosphate oxidase family protein [Azospirillaceae bacterium]
MTDFDKIVRFIVANKVLTLCTVRDGQPWAANCFYAFDPGRVAFLCLSSIETRHGSEMRDHDQVAGTVSSQQATVARIRGLQFSGIAVLQEGEAEAVGRSLYYKRFPFARLYPAPLWAIVLETMKYTDNSFGFGTKFHWRRSR